MKDVTINLQYTTIKDPVPDFIYKSLEMYSSGANTYRPQPTEMIDKLAKMHNVDKEMIFLTAGADEAIQMFIHAFGSQTYTFTPTYVVYSDAREFGNNFNEIFSINKNIFEISTQKIDNATLIFLANPNNPSGFTSKEKVVELITNNSHSCVVIDEAYGDFADLSVTDRIKNFPNMAVVKSFSKGYAMAGNRIGYIIASQQLIAKVKNKTQWSNVSYLSVGAAMAALNHEEYYRAMRAELRERREKFTDFLTHEGFKYLPSKINAVVLIFDDVNEGTGFYDYLVSENIITSHGNGSSNIGLDKSFVRIAVGTEEQMEILKDVLIKYPGKR